MRGRFPPKGPRSMRCVSPRFASARQNRLPPRIVSAAGESKYSTFLPPRRTSARSPIADIVAEGGVSPAGTRRVRHCRTSSSAPTPNSWAGRWLPQMQADSRPISRRCSCASPEFSAGDRQWVAIRSGRMHSQALRIRSQRASSCPNGSRSARLGRNQALDHG